ncbi:MAG: hypothetical protein F2799_01310 [Actinobacteria bacterium]|nr:hypothetical protein [Actinomycetota bacterium]
MNLNLRRLSLITAVVSLVAVCALPAGAVGHLAHSAGNEPESAADRLYAAIKSTHSKQSSGRVIETTCSGRKLPYSCSWWIIKKKSEKRASSDNGQVLSRNGEGRAHSTYSRVYLSGYASATAYNKKNGSFSFRITG